MHISSLSEPKPKSPWLLEALQPSQEDRFSGDHLILREFFMEMVVKHCWWLPSEVVESLSQEMFRE